MENSKTRAKIVVERSRTLTACLALIDFHLRLCEGQPPIVVCKRSYPIQGPKTRKYNACKSPRHFLLDKIIC